ncbi:MAG: DPP IV N-terminal domain-containing protein [Acidobacteriota bacterium]|nr:DPP IV N-terminal domain-containing protein [Acidobacteriota bacterium]
MAVLASAHVFLAAQQDGDRAAALNARIDRIFSTRDFALPRFGPARWLGDGTSYTTVERAPAAGWDIVRYDAASGARSVLVPAARLTPPGAAPLDIDDYQWSADGRRMLIFTNTRKVWRLNTRGDYWVLDVASGRLSKLGAGAPEATLMFAKFSPDATRVAYVRANNLYVERLADGVVTPLTSDGSETTINGTSDWVYEEELGIRDGFRWSPDGRSIAYWQFDSTGVDMFTLINNTDALYPTLTRIPYPKAGTTNSAARIGVVAAGGGTTTWMKTQGDPRQTYLASLEWIDSGTIAMQQLNRLQNQNDYLLADARTGDVRRVFRDASDSWVDVVDDVEWIKGDREFLWLSERDGWRHVYRVPREGGEPALVTRFDADVVSVQGFDERGGWLYFIASPDKATERYLYRAPIDGSAAPERITPAAQTGTHSYTIAPGSGLAFRHYSRFDAPTSIDLVDLPAHRSVRALTDTTALDATLATVIQPAVEFFTVPAGDGAVLDGWMLKPKDFDPSKRYPMIMHVYGEPASQTVMDNWGGNGRLFHRALADAGYIVVSVDNRGTPGPKGAAWRKVVYGAVGELSAKEQAAAARALVARHAFIDGDRIGIWGWSGGGSNTLNAMFRHPDVFRTGVSVAPVPDQKLYDTIYQERYMGVPEGNEEGYRRGSPIHFAEGLRGKLLIVHGSGDDNVHYQGTERLMNRLIELGKPFDMMVYPNRSHSISEGPGTTPHVYRLIARYFLENLPAGGR